MSWFKKKTLEERQEEQFKNYYDNVLCLLQLALYELEHRDCREFRESLDTLCQIYIDSVEIKNEQYRSDIDYIFKSHIKKYEKLDDDDSFKSVIEKLKSKIISK